MRGFADHDRTTRFLARFVNRYVAISKAVREDLLQLGVPEERISLVHNAIRAEIFNDNIEYDYLKEEFNLAPNQLTYGIFGRVVPWKGIREFLYAAKIAAEEFPDAKGFIVGDASDGNEHFLEEMKSLCIELDLADKIIFTGYRKDVSSLMALMDVIVHASIKPEPFGRVIIEGMAMRKPVIAARAGGPLDIVVNGQTGFLIDMQDSAALGIALRELLRNDTLRQSMGHNGQLRAEQLFDNDLYAKKMQDIFQRTRKW
jgi:glycosyltransferase involved in cell wall biosynthesis